MVRLLAHSDRARLCGRTDGRGWAGRAQVHIFESWTALAADPNTAERSQQAFANKLAQPETGILTNDETFAMFMRTCIEKCITDHMVAVQNVYLSTDALARLVLFVARAQAEPLALAHASAGSGVSRPLVRPPTVPAAALRCMHRPRRSLMTDPGYYLDDRPCSRP